MCVAHTLMAVKSKKIVESSEQLCQRWRLSLTIEKDVREKKKLRCVLELEWQSHLQTRCHLKLGWFLDPGWIKLCVWLNVMAMSHLTWKFFIPKEIARQWPRYPGLRALVCMFSPSTATSSHRPETCTRGKPWTLNCPWDWVRAWILNDCSSLFVFQG